MITKPYSHDMEIVRVTLVVIFLSLVIIYVAYFHLVDRTGFSHTPSLSDALVTSGVADLDNDVSDVTLFNPFIPGSGQIGETTIVTSLTGDSSASGSLASGSIVGSDSGVVSGDVSTGSNNNLTNPFSGSIQSGTGTQIPSTITIGSGENGQTTLTNSSEEATAATGTDNRQKTDQTGNQSDSLFPSIITFSGTTQYFGEVSSATNLSISYDYALVDDEGVLYAYLGTGPYDYVSLARNLGGNVVELVTEIDIVKNDLFGEKISFINIPGVTYTTLPVDQRIVVYMIVRYGGDRRLVQVDYASYHRLKSIIKQRFASHYTL